jgi:sulfoxide reductase heme-binding subunit YedZ
MTPLFGTVGHGATSFWYLTRATGLVAMVLLSATVVLGVVCSVDWASERWPRFVSQSVHRNLSLLSLVFIGVHVVTTVADGYVPIGLLDAIVPFHSAYRTLWVGLGACAFDVLVAVAVTTALRRRIGFGPWRGVHWLAYLCWPIALFHALGSGTDTRLGLVLALYVLCVAAVLGALAWRIALATTATARTRIAAAGGGAAVVLTAAVFALLGPLRPGWSQRAGTSSALLAQLSGSHPTPQSAPPATTATPPAPFTSALAGTYAVSGPDNAGNEQMVFTMHLEPEGTALTVALRGSALDGGVELSSGEVTLGGLSGPVTSLEGSNVGALVSGQGRTERLSIQLAAIDNATHAVSGSVSASGNGNR